MLFRDIGDGGLGVAAVPGWCGTHRPGFCPFSAAPSTSSPHSERPCNRLACRPQSYPCRATSLSTAARRSSATATSSLADARHGEQEARHNQQNSKQVTHLIFLPYSKTTGGGSPSSLPLRVHSKTNVFPSAEWMTKSSMIGAPGPGGGGGSSPIVIGSPPQ